MKTAHQPLEEFRLGQRQQNILADMLVGTPIIHMTSRET